MFNIFFISFSVNVFCKLFNFKSFGFFLFLFFYKLNVELCDFVVVVKRYRLEKMLNVFNVEGVIFIVCGGFDGSVRGMVVGVEGMELDMWLKMSMMVCWSVVVVVDEIIDICEFWSLKYNKSVFMNRLVISM